MDVFEYDAIYYAPDTGGAWVLSSNPKVYDVDLLRFLNELGQLGWEVAAFGDFHIKDGIEECIIIKIRIPQNQSQNV